MATSGGFDIARLGDEAQRAYADAISTLERLGENVADSTNALERYAHAVDAFDRLHAEWEEWAKPVVSMGGATGRVLITHPMLPALDQADKRVGRVARELGLTPEARSGLKGAGRPQGSSQSPDRQLRRAA